MTASDPITGGENLAVTLLNTFAPSIAQEQKESLLNAFKNRSQKIEDAVNEAAALPDGVPMVSLHAISDELSVDCGIPAGDLGRSVPVPLARIQGWLNIANAYALLLEKNAAQQK